MIRSNRTPRGFTLLEMVVATAALGFALSAAMYVAVGVSSSAERVRRVGDTQETARLALDALAAEVRMSGAGVSNGQVGIGTTTGLWVGRVPAIYSGPDITVTTSGGQQVVTNSIFIISSEPGAGVPSSDGAGMQGSVVSKTLDPFKGIQVQCTNQLGTPVDCTSPSFKDDTIVHGLWGDPNNPGDNALLVGDYANAVYLRPTKIGASTAGAQPLEFREMGIANGFSTDPKAPFGFAQGASLGKARVTHWYLKQVSPGDWELMRSHPILDDNWAGCGSGSGSPFIDETNSANGPAGTVVGSGPIENLQLRFIVDAGSFDDPQKFVMWGLNGKTWYFDIAGDTVLKPQVTSSGSGYHMGVCDMLPDGTYASRQVREVRASIVARSVAPDHATNGARHVKRYGLASWEGVGPSGGALDEYPRRTFEARIVPRNLQGILRL
jgi:prepilin-type N-terminal cleavage/methylation domain-containing protein